MPYTMKGNSIFKAGPDGEAVGDAVATCDSPEECKAKMDEMNKSAASESANPRARTGYFGELMDLAEATVADDHRSVRVTLIKPGWSANSRYYSKKLLGESAAKFEGTKAYYDHPSKDELKARPERSVRDVAGWYQDVRQESDGRLTASLNVIDDKAMSLIETAVTKNPGLIGLSINALGRTVMGEADGKKGIIVEAIEKANSTDIVTTPAAGGRFDTLMASNSDEFTSDLLKAMPIDELKETLRAARPDLVEAWQKEWKTPRDTGALVSAREEIDALKETVERLSEESRVAKEAKDAAEAKEAETLRHATADRLLKEVKLPKEWAESIADEVKALPDEAAMKAVIEREEKKAALLPTPKLAPKGAGAAVSTPVTESKVPMVITTLLGATYTEAQRKATSPAAFREATKQRLAYEQAQLRENK